MGEIKQRKDLTLPQTIQELFLLLPSFFLFSLFEVVSCKVLEVACESLGESDIVSWQQQQVEGQNSLTFTEELFLSFSLAPIYWVDFVSEPLTPRPGLGGLSGILKQNIYFYIFIS